MKEIVTAFGQLKSFHWKAMDHKDCSMAFLEVILSNLHLFKWSNMSFNEDFIKFSDFCESLTSIFMERCPCFNEVMAPNFKYHQHLVNQSDVQNLKT